MRLDQFLSYAAGMRVALCQIPISSDPAVNLGRAKAALGDAAAAGALRSSRRNAGALRDDLRAVEYPRTTRSARALPRRARSRDRPRRRRLRAGAGDRVYNTAVAFDAHGDLVAAYRKIHLFDALGQRESDEVARGDELVIAEIGGLRIGS